MKLNEYEFTLIIRALDLLKAMINVNPTNIKNNEIVEILIDINNLQEKLRIIYKDE